MSKLVRVGAFALTCVGLQATFDNRLVSPLNYYPWVRTPDRLSMARSDLLFFISNDARNCDGDYIDICNLWGNYDLVQINKSMNEAGITNPLFLTEWQTIDKLPYGGWQHIRAMGVDLWAEYAINRHISLGGACSLLHAYSWGNYLISSEASENISASPRNDCCDPDYSDLNGNDQALERARLNAHELLGICPGPWHKTGLSDLELYARFGRVTDRYWKIKSSDVSLMLGLLVPTGIKANVSSPYSVALGGVGGTGFFARAAASTEFGQDWYIGGWFDVSQRLSKTLCSRLPLGQEPLHFGVLIDRAQVKPGPTVTFSPWLILDCIQDGFGIYAWYLYSHHFCDKWCYAGTRTDVRPRMDRLQNYSPWTQECAAVGIVYDMTKMPTVREHGPRFTMELAFPVDMLGANQSAQMYRLSIGVSCSF